jgi:probable rRNA maturation factor
VSDHDDGAVTVVVADERSASDSPDVVVDLERWQHLARTALVAEGAVGELTLTFVDASEIALLNAEHMGSEGPTDVLSFPLDESPTPGVPTLLGDVVISPAVAAAQCPTHAGTVDDELALLVVHGVLHVLGFDHAEEADAVAMRRRELELLEAQHWGGPAPDGFRQTHD